MIDVKFIVSKLAQPPFNKNMNAIELHDDYTPAQIIQLSHEVMTFIDSNTPNSPFKQVTDLRNEDPEITVIRIFDFLKVLKFNQLGKDFEEFRSNLLKGDRSMLLSILSFILTDIELHQKRAYLFPFLGLCDIPPEFEQDDDISSMIHQIQGLQEQFKESHKYMESMRSTGNTSATLKKEISMMEQEKVQVLTKISKMKKKVEQIPKKDQWLQAAKNYRMEQKNEKFIAERIIEQRQQIQDIEKNIQEASKSLKESKALFVTGGPEAYFNKMDEDAKANKYLASENLPNIIKDLKQQNSDLLQIISQPSITEKDLSGLEQELKNMNQSVAKLTEQKMMLNAGGDGKLALFRQQSSIISRKKESTAINLSDLNEQLIQLQSDLESKKKASCSSTGTKMLKGEEFKQYVNELRAKSTLYKSKKLELTSLTTELGVLSRTEQILKTKEKNLKSKLESIEKTRNVIGFHQTQETLEKVSEKKTIVDEAKGKTLTEISDIVSKLMSTISEKKTLLAPIIQELRKTRLDYSEIENEYLEKKRVYDSTVSHLHGESLTLEQEIKGYQQDLSNDSSRYHYLQMMLQLLEVSQDKVLQEMKAYTGADENLEQIQIARGFKTYRDLYNKKIQEADQATRVLKEQQRQVKGSHEKNVAQLSMFNDLKKLLQIKAQVNKKQLTGLQNKDKTSELNQQENRLVL